MMLCMCVDTCVLLSDLLFLGRNHRLNCVTCCSEYFMNKQREARNTINTMYDHCHIHRYEHSPYCVRACLIKQLFTTENLCLPWLNILAVDIIKIFNRVNSVEWI